jgi:hypothetical protein
MRDQKHPALSRLLCWPTRSNEFVHRFFRDEPHQRPLRAIALAGELIDATLPKLRSQ